MVEEDDMVMIINGDRVNLGAEMVNICKSNKYITFCRSEYKHGCKSLTKRNSENCGQQTQNQQKSPLLLSK